MQYLHDFLAEIEWWKLEPAHELILNQPDDVTRRMVLAKVAGCDFAIAYLPDNDGIEVDLSAFSTSVEARWFDPVRGRNFPVTGRIPNQGNHRFAPPAKGDWVLVIERAPEKAADLFPDLDLRFRVMACAEADIREGFRDER